MKYFGFLVISLIVNACVSIPKQAPQLSEELGGQLNRLEKSHLSLLHNYFEQKRKSLDIFIENTWLPEFASNFFSNEQVQKAWDQIVKSDNSKDRLDFLLSTGPVLQVVINNKRQELVAPLDDVERQLENSIREEYNMARSMNNTLTSFLISAAKVKENQQRYMQMLKITDEKIADAIEKTDGIVETLINQASRIDGAKDTAKALSEKSQTYLDKIKELKTNLK